MFARQSYLGTDRQKDARAVLIAWSGEDKIQLTDTREPRNNNGRNGTNYFS